MAAKRNKICEFCATGLSEPEARNFTEILSQLKKTVPEDERKSLTDGEPQFLFEAMQLYIRAVGYTVGAVQDVAEEYHSLPETAHPESEQEVNRDQDAILSSGSARQLKDLLKAMHEEAEQIGDSEKNYEMAMCVGLLSEMELVIMGSAREGATHAQQQAGWAMLKRLPYVMNHVSEHWTKPALEQAKDDWRMTQEAAREGGSLEMTARCASNGEVQEKRIRFYQTLLDFPEAVSVRIREIDGRARG